jgi:hypothetical protein
LSRYQFCNTILFVNRLYVRVFLETWITRPLISNDGIEGKSSWAKGWRAKNEKLVTDRRRNCTRYVLRTSKHGRPRGDCSEILVPRQTAVVSILPLLPSRQTWNWFPKNVYFPVYDRSNWLPNKITYQSISTQLTVTRYVYVFFNHFRTNNLKM